MAKTNYSFPDIYLYQSQLNASRSAIYSCRISRRRAEWTKRTFRSTIPPRWRANLLVFSVNTRTWSLGINRIPVLYCTRKHHINLLTAGGGQVIWEATPKSTPRGIHIQFPVYFEPFEKCWSYSPPSRWRWVNRKMVYYHPQHGGATIDLSASDCISMNYIFLSLKTACVYMVGVFIRVWFTYLKDKLPHVGNSFSGRAGSAFEAVQVVSREHEVAEIWEKYIILLSNSIIL